MARGKHKKRRERGEFLEAQARLSSDVVNPEVGDESEAVDVETIVDIDALMERFEEGLGGDFMTGDEEGHERWLAGYREGLVRRDVMYQKVDASGDFAEHDIGEHSAVLLGQVMSDHGFHIVGFDRGGESRLPEITCTLENNDPLLVLMKVLKNESYLMRFSWEIDVGLDVSHARGKSDRVLFTLKPGKQSGGRIYPGKHRSDLLHDMNVIGSSLLMSFMEERYGSGGGN